MEMFENAAYWYWFIAGAVLLILEMALPGVLFLWLAIAAALVGGLVFVVPDLGWQIQVLVFAVLSVVSALIGRSVLKARPIQTDNPTLSRRGEQYVGQTFVLKEPVTDGRGRLKIGDSSWTVRGQDMEAGTKIRIAGISGNTFEIEKAES